MTQPIQEPSDQRSLQGLAYQRDQLLRRPGPPPVAPAAGLPKFEIKVFADTRTVTVGDGKFILAIPDELNGYIFDRAAAYVTTASGSGQPTVQIRNVTDAVDMLTTKITIDTGEFTSYTASAQPVINTSADDVATGDLIAIDVDVAGSNAKGLGVILGFSPP